MTGKGGTTVALPAPAATALAGLKLVQRKFVVSYCEHGNGVLAAKQAGVKGTYWSQAAAASKWLKEPKIRAAVETWLTTFAMTAAEVTAGLADLARAHLGAFVAPNAEGQLNLRPLTEDEWAAHRHWIRSVDADPETGRVTRIVLHDALRARDLLAKALKLYGDAPIVNLFFVRQMSDEQLLADLEEARAAVGYTGVLSPN